MKQFRIRWISILAVVLSFLIGTICIGAEDQVIGIVKTVKGSAVVLRNQQTLPAASGLLLQVGDVLQTSADGSVGVILRDDSVISLGPNSRLVIDNFVFAPDKEQFGILVRIMNGTMAYLSGVITKLSPGSAKIETPVATIGIRGTMFAVNVEGEP